MVIMAVDLGKARTGLAVCDSGEMLASPVCVIAKHPHAEIIDKIKEYISIYHPQLFVVGLPKNMDGSEGSSAENARTFAQLLKISTGIDTVMQDERGTTITACNYLNKTDTKGKKRKAVVDSVAAVIILEDYLQYRKNHNKEKNT